MFYKLGINPSSKKWAKYENISSSLWVDNIETTSTKLFTDPDLLRNGKQIEYTTGLRIKCREYRAYYRIKKLSSIISGEFSKN